MKRGWIIFWALTGCLAALLTGIVPAVRQIRQQQTEQAYLADLKRQILDAGEQESRHQINLAKWYNWNLQAQQPDPDFRRAYGQILRFREGAMGILSLETDEMPIYHQDFVSAIPGAVHRGDSALPIGGRGNCCILQLPEDIDLSQFTSGAMVGILCAGRKLCYQVIAQGENPSPMSDRLILVSSDGQTQILLRRCETVSIREKGTAETDAQLLLWAGMGAVSATLLPIFAGILLSGVGGLRQHSENDRKVKGKTEIQR